MLVYWIWLSQLREATARQKAELMRRFTDAEELFFASGDDLEGIAPELVKALGNKDLTDAERILGQCVAGKIGVLPFYSARYPRLLRNISDPPAVLYYRGRLPDFEAQPVIAVVGTRKATPYGLSSTRRLSGQIAWCGGLVLSGAADGIDAAAMRGALELGCSVAAVLGNGVDVVYPRCNRDLYEQTVENGCLLSEYPPGSRPERYHFPQRNRIISGISNGVLVTEAPQVSGALITARSALEQGRDVFAVPGNIDVAACAGSNALLQEGATPVMSGWDVMKQYRMQFPDTVENRPLTMPDPGGRSDESMVAQPENRKIIPPSDKKDVDIPADTSYSGMEIPSSGLSEQEKLILAQLSPTPKAVDDVIAATGLPAPKVLSLLTTMALKGLVDNHPGRTVSTRRK